MKQTGRMELDEFHVRDRRARAPGHRHAVARRDVRVGRVEINFPATAGRQDQPIGANRFDFGRRFVEHINAEATVFRGEPEFAGRDQIDRHVVFQQFDSRRAAQLAQQRLLDFRAGHVLHMQDAPLRMSAFAPEIELAMSGNFALVEMQSELDQLANARRTFRDDRAHRRSSQSPAPASSVSRTCSSKESSSLVTQRCRPAPRPCSSPRPCAS